MTKEEAKEVFLNRGIIDGIYDGDKWREACIVISEWLEQEPFINKPCVSSGVCEHDKNKVLDKIRAEIKDLDIFYDNDYFSGNRDAMFKCNDVLQVIDKYKGESEG